MNRDFKQELMLYGLVHKQTGCSLHIQSEKDIHGNEKLLAYTYNPEKDISFLMGLFDNYEQLQKYIEADSTELSSFTIEWAYKSKKTQSSYFRETDAEEAVKKFYSVVPKEKVTIYMVKLNPIS